MNRFLVGKIVLFLCTMSVSCQGPASREPVVQCGPELLAWAKPHLEETLGFTDSRVIVLAYFHGRADGHWRVEYALVGASFQDPDGIPHGLLLHAVRNPIARSEQGDDGLDAFRSWRPVHSPHGVHSDHGVFPVPVVEAELQDVLQAWHAYAGASDPKRRCLDPDAWQEIFGTRMPERVMLWQGNGEFLFDDFGSAGD